MWVLLFGMTSRRARSETPNRPGWVESISSISSTRTADLIPGALFMDVNAVQKR